MSRIKNAVKNKNRYFVMGYDNEFLSPNSWFYKIKPNNIIYLVDKDGKLNICQHDILRYTIDPPEKDYKEVSFEELPFYL